MRWLAGNWTSRATSSSPLPPAVNRPASTESPLQARHRWQGRWGGAQHGHSHGVGYVPTSPALLPAVRARPADGPAPLYAALGCDRLPAVETPALVLVIVGQVLGSQLQAVVASGSGRFPGPDGLLALLPYVRLGKTRCTSAASVHPVKRILLCVPCLGRMEARVSRSRRLRLPWASPPSSCPGSPGR